MRIKYMDQSNNHPSRNWRSRMRAAADQWLQTDMAKTLLTSLANMRARLREAYLAGYADGRKSRENKDKSENFGE